MNLLPKSADEFAHIEYWDSFFKKLGDNAFEWYGEYIELCDQIHKYVKKRDKILMLGCGNSKLSMDMYDAGFEKITNIDLSSVAIRAMKDMCAQKRREMEFLEMDATQMSFPDKSFSVEFDKGTLDALFTDNTNETRATIEKYFGEISRTLTDAGRYLCISLLQEHILNYILQYFSSRCYLVRVIHCFDTERVGSGDKSTAVRFPVFLVAAIKFTNLKTPIFEFCFHDSKLQRVDSALEILKNVQAIQKAALICNSLCKTSIAGHNEVSLDLYTPGEENKRFTVYILDQNPSRELSKYGCFIVPQGREVEWIFATPEGRLRLQETAKFQRLVIVTLHRNQEFGTLREVQTELAETVRYLAPLSLKEQIPFLTLGTDLGERTTLVTGCSKFSGDFTVEEVRGTDQKLFRRLIFLKTPFIIQSEALVKTIKLKGNKERKKIDFGYLACEHHMYMAIGVQLACMQALKNTEKHVLVIGLGGGNLCSFLHGVMPNLRITAVEIDPIILEIAEQFFELKQDKRFHVVIDDGVSFLETCNKEADIKFDAVIFDVDNKDITLGLSCPPKEFLNKNVLENVKKLIGEKGLFLLNLVCRDVTLRDQYIKEVQEIFPSVCSYKLQEDLNEVFYCANVNKYKIIDDWKKVLRTSANSLNNLVKEAKFSKLEMLDVTEFLKDLKI